MERDSSKRSEFNSSSSEDEAVSSSETDKKKNKKSQSDNERVWSRITAQETKPSGDKPKTAERLSTLWHREPEKTEANDHDPEEESADEERLGELSHAETKEIAETYLTARRQEIAHELTEQTDGIDDQVEAQAALAADAYLAAVEDKLQAESTVDINDATEEAYNEAVQNYAPESLSADDDSAKPEAADIDKENIGDGDDGKEPPTWRSAAFPPEGRYSFGASSNRNNNLETVIERDFAAERVATVRGLLVGGIIGYLIGRRRGRIKTEKRLIPIQRRLENEVASLYSTISLKETQLRTLVKQRDRALRPNRPEVVHDAAPNFIIDQKPSSPEALKANKANLPEAIKPPSSSVEIVNHENLLKAGEKIRVGSTTLRKVFETGLISERGLRRAVEEYSKGGDIRRVLAEEVLIKELGYELDPQLRDRPLTKVADPLTSSIAPQAASHEEALANIRGQNMAPSKDVDNPLPPPLIKQRTVPSLLITANVLALVVLGILLLILIITHK